jgi:hypothetical protein
MNAVVVALELHPVPVDGGGLRQRVFERDLYRFVPLEHENRPGHCNPLPRRRATLPESECGLGTESPCFRLHGQRHLSWRCGSTDRRVGPGRSGRGRDPDAEHHAGHPRCRVVIVVCRWFLG